jgi:hypothetical protein
METAHAVEKFLHLLGVLFVLGRGGVHCRGED